MTTIGTVTSWSNEDGWGVVESAETPGGCWVHFSHVEGAGYRSLTPGQTVNLESERADQDGYRFRAIRVWPTGTEPAADTSTIGADQDPSTGPHGWTTYSSLPDLSLDDPSRNKVPHRQQ